MANEQLTELATCVAIAFAASSISITITQTEVFAPWRTFTKRMGHMVGYLFQCFYCIKHWIVFLGIAVYRPVLVHSEYLFVDLVVSAFFTITISTLISGLMFKVFLLAMNKKTKELEINSMLSK